MKDNHSKNYVQDYKDYVDYELSFNDEKIAASLLSYEEFVSEFEKRSELLSLQEEDMDYEKE